MKELMDRTVQLRIEDGYRFMLEHFSRDDDLGLKGKLVKCVTGGPCRSWKDMGKP